MSKRKSSYVDALLLEEEMPKERKKLNHIEYLILSKHNSMHPKEISGTGKVIAKARKVAEKQMEFFCEVINDMSVQDFDALTREEKIEAGTQLIKEKKVEMNALSEIYDNLISFDRVLKKLTK